MTRQASRRRSSVGVVRPAQQRERLLVLASAVGCPRTAATARPRAPGTRSARRRRDGRASPTPARRAAWRTRDRRSPAAGGERRRPRATAICTMRGLGGRSAALTRRRHERHERRQRAPEEREPVGQRAQQPAPARAPSRTPRRSRAAPDTSTAPRRAASGRRGSRGGADRGAACRTRARPRRRTSWEQVEHGLRQRHLRPPGSASSMVRVTESAGAVSHSPSAAPRTAAKTTAAASTSRRRAAVAPRQHRRREGDRDREAQVDPERARRADAASPSVARAIARGQPEDGGRVDGERPLDAARRRQRARRGASRNTNVRSSVNAQATPASAAATAARPPRRRRREHQRIEPERRRRLEHVMIDARVMPGHTTRRDRRRRDAAEPRTRRAPEAHEHEHQKKRRGAPRAPESRTRRSPRTRAAASAAQSWPRADPVQDEGSPIGHGQSNVAGALTKRSPTPGGNRPRGAARSAGTGIRIGVVGDERPPYPRGRRGLGHAQPDGEQATTRPIIAAHQGASSSHVARRIGDAGVGEALLAQQARVAAPARALVAGSGS